MTDPRDNSRLRKATNELLDPKNDYVFKRLFVRRPQLLVALINAVRPDAPPVRCVEIRNPGIDGEELGAKAIVLDVLAQDQSGHIYDIEMQVRETVAIGHPSFLAPIFFGGCRSVVVGLRYWRSHGFLRKRWQGDVAAAVKIGQSPRREEWTVAVFLGTLL